MSVSEDFTQFCSNLWMKDTVVENKEAQKALKIEGKQTFTDEDVDSLLPSHLRRTKTYMEE